MVKNESESPLVKSISIDDKTLKILSALGRDPVSPIQSLGVECGVSSSTLKKRLTRLYNEKILIGISAQIGTFVVGLEPVVAFLEAGPEQWSTVERFCDLYPYTRYRILSFGACNGFFTQFAVPPHTSYLLTELLDRLVHRRAIKSYELVGSVAATTTTETDFGFYDVVQGWEFDWEAWEGSIAGSEETPRVSPPPGVLHRLDEADMRILRQLSVNARRKSLDIAAEAEVEPYHLSRRKKIMEGLGVIQGYRVVVGMQLLQLTSHAILRCECSMEISQRIATAVKALPFQSTFIPTLDGFLLYVTITSLDFPALVTALQRHCDSVMINWCDYRSSFRYWFYDEPYRDGKWTVDYDYMVESVLSKL